MADYFRLKSKGHGAHGLLVVDVDDKPFRDFMKNMESELAKHDLITERVLEEVAIQMESKIKAYLGAVGDEKWRDFMIPRTKVEITMGGKHSLRVVVSGKTEGEVPNLAGQVTGSYDERYNLWAVHEFGGHFPGTKVEGAQLEGRGFGRIFIQKDTGGVWVTVRQIGPRNVTAWQGRIGRVVKAMDVQLFTFLRRKVQSVAKKFIRDALKKSIGPGIKIEEKTKGTLFEEDITEEDLQAFDVVSVENIRGSQIAYRAPTGRFVAVPGAPSKITR